MPIQLPDEEKALLAAYHDDENHTDEPPKYPDPVDQEEPRTRRKKKCGKKIWRHIIGFTILYFVWKGFHSHWFRGMGAGCGKDMKPVPKEFWDVTEGAWDGPLAVELDQSDLPWPAQLTLEECAAWPEDDEDDRDRDHDHKHPRHPHRRHDHHEHSFDSSFNLPVSSEALAFFAKGPASAGTFNIEQGTEDIDQIVVDVTTKWRGPRKLLDNVELCKFKGPHGEAGVGIVSVKPEHHHRKGRVHFDINVRLPSNNVELKKLFTYLPVFAHSIGDIGKNVHFDTVALKSAVAHVDAESLSGNNITVNAGLGSIRGKFRTSSSLELVVSGGGEIDVSTELVNDPSSDHSTDLILKSSISAIKADISLLTSGDEEEGGNYNITTSFSTGSATLSTLTAPKNSTVDLTVNGGVGAINVGLHETFEGQFDVSTSLFSKAKIVEPTDARTVEYEQAGRGVVKGWVFDEKKGKEGKERGRVTLGNSMGGVTLQL